MARANHKAQEEHLPGEVQALKFRSSVESLAAKNGNGHRRRAQQCLRARLKLMSKDLEDQR